MSVVPTPSPLVPVAPVPVETEAPPETPPQAAQAPADQVSRQFAALSKKEKALYRQQEALKAERAALQAEKAEAEALKAKYGAKPANPREALERYGFDYKTATEFELNDGAPTAEFLARQAQAEIQKLREEQADREKRQQQESLQRAEQEKAQVVQDFKVEIQDFVAEKADDFELIKFHEAYEVVYLTIEQHYQKTGKLLSIPEGANIVEKYLEKKARELQGLKKFATTREPGQPPQPESGFSRQPTVPAQRRTLDNTVTSSTPTLVKNPQVEDDRMKRALAALDRR
jgi:hypothetical protein